MTAQPRAASTSWSSALLGRPWIAAAASYVVLAMVVLAPALAPGRTVVPADIVNVFAPWESAVPDRGIHSPLVSDASLQFFPWLDFLGDSLRDGGVPEWNPYLLGGLPFTPNGYVTAYYPPYLLAGVVDPLDAYTLYVALHLVIAALGTYAFARVLGVRPLAAWIAGLCAFTALHWVHWSLHLNHSSGMALLPAVLAATEWAVRRPGRRQVAALALLFGLWWAGGGLQYTYYGSLAVAGYALAALVRRGRVGRSHALRSTAALAGGFGLGAMLAAPVLVPTASVSDAIVRKDDPVGVLTQTHFVLVDLLLLVMPDARGNANADVLYRGYPYGWALDTPFFGIAALLLACAGLAVLGRRRLAVAVGAGAALTLAYTAWPHELLYEYLPGYNRFRVSSRWLAVLPAFALPLAAVGTQAIFAGERAARRALYGAAAVAAAAILSYAAYVALDAAAPKRFFAAAFAAVLLPLAAVVAAGRVAPGRRSLALGLVAGAVLFEAAAHTATFYPFVRKAEAYPRLEFAEAIAARGGAMIRVTPEFVPLGAFPPDLPMVYGITDAQGQSVLFPADYDRYLRLVQDYGTYASDTNTAPPLTDPNLLSSPLVRALDVRTAVTDPSVRMPARYGLVADAGIRAYALSSPGPATLVPSAMPATEEEMWRAIARSDWDPAGSSAVVGLANPVRGGRGDVELVSRTAAAERWRVRSPRGGLLRVSGSHDRGWSARIDGDPAKVLRADGVFRAVAVPPGEHEVAFSYSNPDERRGRLVALAAVAALVALLVPWRRLR